MRRTTVTLPIEMLDALERAARRGRTSVSEIVRRMLADQLGMIAGQERPLPFADLGRSGHRFTARGLEAMVAEDWTPDRDR
jgi:Arc/MetJ-type ribon-helix-helix transcriptional regulator